MRCLSPCQTKACSVCSVSSVSKHIPLHTQHAIASSLDSHHIAVPSHAYHKNHAAMRSEFSLPLPASIEANR